MRPPGRHRSPYQSPRLLLPLAVAACLECAVALTALAGTSAAPAAQAMPGPPPVSRLLSSSIPAAAPTWWTSPLVTATPTPVHPAARSWSRTVRQSLPAISAAPTPVATSAATSSRPAPTTATTSTSPTATATGTSPSPTPTATATPTATPTDTATDLPTVPSTTGADMTSIAASATQ